MSEVFHLSIEHSALFYVHTRKTCKTIKVAKTVLSTATVLDVLRDQGLSFEDILVGTVHTVPHTTSNTVTNQLQPGTRYLFTKDNLTCGSNNPIVYTVTLEVIKREMVE